MKSTFKGPTTELPLWDGKAKKKMKSAYCSGHYSKQLKFNNSSEIISSFRDIRGRTITKIIRSDSGVIFPHKFRQGIFDNSFYLIFERAGPFV